MDKLKKRRKFRKEVPLIVAAALVVIANGVHAKAGRVISSPQANHNDTEITANPFAPKTTSANNVVQVADYAGNSSGYYEPGCVDLYGISRCSPDSVEEFDTQQQERSNTYNLMTRSGKRPTTRTNRDGDVLKSNPDGTWKVIPRE